LLTIHELRKAIYFDPINRKFYTFVDVTFESVPYFAPITSCPIPQLMPSSGDLEKEIVPKPSSVFTRCPKNVVSTSLPADLESTPADLDPSHSTCSPLFMLRWILLTLQT